MFQSSDINRDCQNYRCTTQKNDKTKNGSIKDSCEMYQTDTAEIFSYVIKTSFETKKHHVSVVSTTT